MWQDKQHQSPQVILVKSWRNRYLCTYLLSNKVLVLSVSFDIITVKNPGRIFMFIAFDTAHDSQISEKCCCFEISNFNIGDGKYDGWSA